MLNIGYDGADYHGWQVQKNAVTVQEVFQNAVEKVFGARLPVKGCSRTDSGVHANCYFVSFQTELSIACDGVVRALNTVLPKDIAVLDCREVPLDFHPRYCCREKEYVYKLYNGAIRDPFLLRYAYQYRYPIYLERMQQGAKAFLGTHDFRGFCSARSDVEDTVRTITAFTVERQGDMYCLRSAQTASFTIWCAFSLARCFLSVRARLTRRICRRSLKVGSAFAPVRRRRPRGCT